MLALDARCSDDTASWTRACKLGRAGLTSEAEECTMRWCLGDFGVGSGIDRDIVIVEKGGIHGRVGVHG